MHVMSIENLKIVIIIFPQEHFHRYNNYSLYETIGFTDVMTPFLSLTAGINFIEVNLLSVSGDLSTQHIEVNCFTFRVKPYQVTWRIGSELITQVHAYLSMNGSELLNSINQTYRQYISLKGSFSNGTNISCSTTVNGKTSIEKYLLQGISHH